MDIGPEIEKVEFKFTAVREDEGRVLAFLDGHAPKRREVYFYDTKELSLKAKHVFLRGRVTDGAGESTVKLRPVGQKAAVAAKDDNDEIRIELDVVGAEDDRSAKLDCEPVDPSAIETGDMARLFTDEQMALIKRFAGDGALEGVEMLGPITARVWEIEDLAGFPFKLGAEEWSMPDLQFVELSIKVKPGKADEAQAAFGAFLAGLVKDTTGDRSRKTEQALRFFAEQLEPH